MKKTALILALLIAGCATDLITQETVAMRSVTIARQVSTNALLTNKISWDQEVKNRTYLDGLRDAIKSAVAVNDTKAVAANQAAAEAFDPVKGK